MALSHQRREMLDELKRYLDKNFPPEHEGPSGATPEWFDEDEFEWVRSFNQQLARDGWLVSHWPQRYGGHGLSPLDNMLIRDELSYRRVPIANANGLDMLAPILLELGTEEQKQEHLPKIASVERQWCQGFSEPEAGSDLTSLRTTARRDGDHYVVNGSKIWTGHAMHADWMILLARTDLESRGSRGLSLLMVDLSDPGVTIHPIRSLTGGVTFCQEFFTDVRVPATNLVGPEHNGWRASNTLLQHERARANPAALYRRDLDDLLAAVVERGGADVPTEIALGKMIERVESALAMAYDTATVLAEDEGRFPTHMPSVMKIVGAELAADVSELATDTLGLDVGEYTPPQGHWDFWQEFLYSPVARIGGGSYEIQHDIIAASCLGLGR